MSAARSLDRKIRDCTKAERRSRWLLARYLAEFVQVEGWKELGFRNQTEYAKSLDMGYRDFYRYVRVWRVFGNVATRSDMDNTDFSKICIAMQAVSAGTVSAHRALSDCRKYTARDLRARYGFGPAACDQPDTIELKGVLETLLSILEDKAWSDADARILAQAQCEYHLQSANEILA